jgi:hypothetical protein
VKEDGRNFIRVVRPLLGKSKSRCGFFLGPPACNGVSRYKTVKKFPNVDATIHFVNETWIFLNSVFTARNMYSYIGTYISYLRRDQKERIVYVSAEQLPDDGFAIEHDCILLPLVNDPHPDPFLHASDAESSDIEADCENACIDP